MDSKIDPGEAATIRDLLSDFASDPGISVKEVNDISWARYSKLVELLSHLELPLELYEHLPLAAHRFIYSKLFTFAGKYRQVDDPFGGRIYFGPQNAQKYRPEFIGSTPDRIENKIREAVKYLKMESSNEPLFNAAVFYQKFVKIHPFYDANGRIGRLMVALYLNSFGQELSWAEFNDKKDFLGKLNWCHKTESKKSYTVLVNYLRNFLHSTSTFEDL